MPTPFDHALALVLAILFPIRARMAYFGRLARATEDELPHVRLGVYRGAILVQWLLAAAAVGLWIFARRPWPELGVIPVWSGGLIGILLGLAAVVLVVLRTSGTAPDARSAEALRRRTKKIERLMPRSPRDLRWFYALSLTAGICEELLYRGYLIWYLQMFGLALVPAAAISSLIFGFGHLYQGPRGMLQTALVGAFLAGVYLLSGSLLPGMLIHAMMDAYSGRLLYSVHRSGDPHAPDSAAEPPVIA